MTSWSSKSDVEIWLGVSRITQSVQGMSKNDFRTSLEILKFHDLLKFFFHPESQIHIRLRDLKGSKLVRKTRFEVLRSSQSTRGMCRNDPRTSLEKVIFLRFFKVFIIFEIRARSGDFRDFGGSAAGIDHDMSMLGVRHAQTDHKIHQRDA